MGRVRKIMLTVVSMLVVALVAAYWWQRPLLLTGTGYAAHNACALAKIAGRDDVATDLPPNPLVPVLRTKDAGSSTEAGILGVLARQQAWATDGFGCTISDERPELPAATTVTSEGNPYTDAPAPPVPTDRIQDALDRAFGADLSPADRDDLGTRAIIVLKDGELVAEEYGDGFGADIPQLGWSMAKSITNLMVGRLVRTGEVSLDDDQLRPEWKGDRADITVRQLLQMTSGLSWDETYALGTPITRMLYLEPDMGRYVAGRELAHEPGEYQQYSSGNTNVLCSVIAPDHGGADLPRRLIFEPLGLSSAVWEPDAAGTPVCSSYLWATPRDWAALGQFVLDDGVWNGERLLPPGWMRDSTAPVDVETQDPGYASGWWTNRRPGGTVLEPGLPEDAYWAQGHDGQKLIVVPSEKLVVVRLGFTPVRDDDRALQLAADLVTATG